MGFGPFDDVRPQMRRRAFDTGDFSGLSIKPEKHTLLPEDLNPRAPGLTLPISPTQCLPNSQSDQSGGNKKPSRVASPEIS
jgi:hypothetical protein